MNTMNEMNVKVIFVGNPVGGDDGIGPYLYNLLKEDNRLKKLTLLELGVIGLDMISYVEKDDQLIIVDAIYSEKDFGKVRLLEEKDLSNDLSIVSLHDFGVEQTIKMLRVYEPKLKKINLIGINVKNIAAFSDKISDELMTNIETIKEDVVKSIKTIIKNTIKSKGES